MDVVNWESQFWKLEKEPGVFEASIDTTFALYRPFCYGKASPYKEAYRTGYPYLIKHLPWYIDSSNLNEEDTFYFKTISQITHWSKR